MKTAKLDLIIQQGATFRKTFIFAKDREGKNPIDIAGFSARMHIREKPGDDILLLELTSENGMILVSYEPGRIDLDIPYTITTNITWKRAYYDLELIKDDLVSRPIEGIIRVTPEITK